MYFAVKCNYDRHRDIVDILYFKNTSEFLQWLNTTDDEGDYVWDYYLKGEKEVYLLDVSYDVNLKVYDLEWFDGVNHMSAL